jgi:septal ring factor EnvC (AmiA/AmiB activator)
MNGFHKALVVASLCVVGIWGCAQGQPGATTVSAERLKALEQKTAKLEDDFRAVATVRDQLRKKLTAAEDQEQELRQQLTAAQESERKLRAEIDDRLLTVNRDRDELRVQLAARTAERDSLQGQYEQFRKTIREVLGQAEASLPTPSRPVTTVEAAAPGKL